MAPRTKLAEERAAARYDFSSLKDQPLVYFVQIEGGGPVYLAASDRLEERYAALQEANPHRLVILGVVRTADGKEMLELEETLRKEFRSWHIHGHWYQPAKKLLSFISERAEAVPVESLTIEPDRFESDASLPNSVLPPHKLAAQLGVSLATVRRWTRNGRIPALRLSSRIIRYDVFQVVEALERAR